MAIPTPPLDNSGGYMVVKYSNGSITHRLRVHLAPFNADATGTYSGGSPPAEGNVAATFTAFVAKLLAYYNTTWTFSLDAVYRNVAGVIGEIFTITAPATQAGTLNAGAFPNPLTETFVCQNWKTSGGGRARIFLITPSGWTYSVALNVVPNAGGNADQVLAAYMVSAATGVRGHDGNVLAGNMRKTLGVNKRIRRRVGDA